MSDADCTPGREPRSVAASTFCSFTVLNKLKSLQLSTVGLSTIKHHHSKKLT